MVMAYANAVFIMNDLISNQQDQFGRNQELLEKFCDEFDYFLLFLYDLQTLKSTFKGG